MVRLVLAEHLTIERVAQKYGDSSKISEGPPRLKLPEPAWTNWRNSYGLADKRLAKG